MPLPIFPAHIFNPQAIKADAVPSMISGGESLSGITTTILTDGGGKWSVVYSGINLRAPRQLRLWDMWTSYMPGRAFLVPLVSLFTAPRPTTAGSLARPSALHADDPDFPTVVRQASPYIVASLTAPVALRATQMTMRVAQGARIEGGERFSINGRAFKIERVLSRSDQTVTVSTFPPAREALQAGADVNFEWPVVQCRLVGGQDLAPNQAFGRHAEVSISFVEDFSDAN